MKIFKKYMIFFLFAASMVFIDQITKHIAIIHLKNQDEYKLIEDVLVFHYLENRGIAWGMFEGKMKYFIVSTLLIGIFFLFCLIWIEQKFNYVQRPKQLLLLQWSIVGMFAGAMGNFIDRIFLGYVVDFIYIKCIDFPIFNTADCYVTVCSFIVLYLLVFGLNENDCEILFSKRRKTA